MQTIQDRTKGIGFSVRNEDLKKIEEIKTIFNAKNNSEAVRIAIDLAYMLTKEVEKNGLETKQS